MCADSGDARVTATTGFNAGVTATGRAGEGVRAMFVEGTFGKAGTAGPGGWYMALGWNVDPLLADAAACEKDG